MPEAGRRGQLSEDGVRHKRRVKGSGSVGFMGLGKWVCTSRWGRSSYGGRNGGNAWVRDRQGPHAGENFTKINNSPNSSLHFPNLNYF